MTVRRLFYSLLISLSVICISGCSRSGFWSADENNITKNGVSEYFIGTNLWYAGRLAGSEEGRSRLSRELDRLKQLGITNLRILAVEGENLDDLEYALDEMNRRGMCAVLFLNNAWEWSFGYADYLERSGAGVQPRPATEGYQAYMEAMGAFCCNRNAVELNHQYISKIVKRFRNHPAIFSWQICNEPRCFSDDPAARDLFVEYIHGTAALIKSLDGNHMVSTGNEGSMGCEEDMELCLRINDCPDIDYMTIHIWPYNWSWVREDSVNDGMEYAVQRVEQYIDEHLEIARRTHKPMVIEEFGYPRDGFEFSRTSPTDGRDRIYDCVFSRVVKSALMNDYLAGCNFWGWGGFAEPAHVRWEEGDDLCGDPAQEQQGLNSVFASDSSTMTVIGRAVKQLSAIGSHNNDNDADGIRDILIRAAADGTPLFGHQDDLMYGHFWNATKEDDHDLTRSDVLSTAGAYPFILGLDLGGLETGSRFNLDGNDFDLMREAAVKHHERGGIITLSWHLRNPLTGGDAWDVSSDSVVESLLPGGGKHGTFIGWLDKVSDFIESLKDSEGRQIPVIWRPWHEHTGGWFWWGGSHCTPEQFNDLWRMTYSYMEYGRGLKGLLWAISPNSSGMDFDKWEEKYPGDDFVDIVGLDCYCPTYVSQEQALPMFVDEMNYCLECLNNFASAHGKVLAVTETGYEGLTSGNWWTGTLAPAMKGFPAAYLLVWRNTDERPRGLTHFYAPWPGGPTEADFTQWVKDNNVKLLK